MACRLSLLPHEEFRRAGNDAVVLIRRAPFWNRYRTVLVFLSMRNEIDTAPVIKAALDDGKEVYAPCIENERLWFYRVKTSEGHWKNGRFGIREPLPETPLEAKDFPALVFTPGLAFDREGNRLGRGGGYYDRFLAQLENEHLPCETAGLCLKTQITASVPADKWDKPVNTLFAL